MNRPQNERPAALAKMTVSPSREGIMKDGGMFCGWWERIMMIAFAVV